MSCRPSVRFSVCLSVRHGCIVAKRCKIELKLLLITNRKSHTGFQMTYKSLTLDDLERSKRTMQCQSWGIMAKR